MNTELIKLEPNESILRVVRKHWFILFSQVFSIGIAGVFPFALIFLGSLFPLLSDLIAKLHVTATHISFFSGAWLLLVHIALVGIWTDYYLDMWIITNKRIISIDQQGFFRRSVSSFRFERLQDITIDIRGIIETMLDFGRITADTAGHDPFTIRGIPNPREVKSLILEHADQVIHSTLPKDFL